MGRVIARRLQSLHRATAVLLRAYSPMLLEEVLQPTCIECGAKRSPAAARLLEAGDAKPGFTVDERWSRRAPGPLEPPGLVMEYQKRRAATPEPPPYRRARSLPAEERRLKLGSDYRAIGPSLRVRLVPATAAAALGYARGARPVRRPAEQVPCRC